jgi:FkbM family methyltransferase
MHLTDLARTLIPRPVRNFCRSPRASFRWLRHELAFALGHRPTWRVTPDWEVRCHPASLITFRTHSEDEEFREELAGFIRSCRPGMTLLDVGSHYGLFTLAAVRYGGPSSRVLAVDPSLVCNRILRSNLRLAGSAGQVTVVQAAVGDRNGKLPMLTGGPAGQHFLIAADQARPDVRLIPQVTLPELASRMPSPPSHVKIDVEGFEAEVLEGAKGWWGEHRPLVFLELHGDLLRRRGRRPQEVLAALAGDGYRFERRGRPIAADEAAGLEVARLVCRPEARRPPPKPPEPPTCL